MTGLSSEVQDRLVTAGDLQFHLRDWGSTGKPPLILLHGLASTSQMFDLIAPAFVKDYHVIAIDQRGHGLSGKPDSGYTFETVSKDLDNLVAALGFSDKKIILGGHSWGGATALYYAATRAERVAKTLLLDGGTRVMQDRYPTWDEARIGMAPPRFQNVDVDRVTRMIRERMFAGSFRPELEPLALSIFDLSDPSQVHARLSFDNHMQIAQNLWAFKPTDYYAQVTGPVLIIYAIPPGSQLDPALQQYANMAQAQLKRAQIVWMQETLHDMPWHRPAELAEIIRCFLESTT